MEEKCRNCEEQQACIPFFIHENAMQHKDMDNERMAKIVKGQRITNIIQSIVILLIVFIMAMFYTSRTHLSGSPTPQARGSQGLDCADALPPRPPLCPCRGP